MWWWSFGWWWLGLMVLAMVVCFAFMAVMRGSGRGMGWMGMGRMCGFGRWDADRGDAKSILDERLARGEIDVEDHRKLSAALAGPGSAGEQGD